MKKKNENGYPNGYKWDGVKYSPLRVIFTEVGEAVMAGYNRLSAKDKRKLSAARLEWDTVQFALNGQIVGQSVRGFYYDSKSGRQRVCWFNSPPRGYDSTRKLWRAVLRDSYEFHPADLRRALGL